VIVGRSVGERPKSMLAMRRVAARAKGMRAMFQAFGYRERFGFRG
jgi:hypothetical protein